MLKIRISALLLIVTSLAIGFFVYTSEVKEESKFAFKYGLDLSGGTHLVYKADISSVEEGEVQGAMGALRDVIERRVNMFGVSEPIVQVEESGIFAGVSEQRLIVELPGVTDIEEAVKLIGETPLLEFKLLPDEIEQMLREQSSEQNFTSEAFVATELTGRYLKRAQLNFAGTQGGQLSNEPIVVLEFDKEGSDLFEKITGENVGKTLAIFLDGVPISTPVIREAISGGRATISGSFSPEEAKSLVQNLNFGALPLPIELLSTQSIGASLGSEALQKGVVAGAIGLILVAIFLIAWYRLPGVLAVMSLTTYIFIMLAIFKLIPVTLTAAGVAGFILSIGMAVDANILIFERMKEELRDGRKNTKESVRDGFNRAWVAIRDGNISSIITAIILFWFGTSLVEGFALTFGVGIMVSMFTAITVTRTFLYALGQHSFRGVVRVLFGSGIKY